MVLGGEKNLGSAFQREFKLLVVTTATCGFAHCSSGHADVDGIDSGGDGFGLRDATVLYPNGKCRSVCDLRGCGLSKSKVISWRSAHVVFTSPVCPARV